MRPLVGWGLGGATFTARDLASTPARIGEPTWGPAGLVRDLELRLGLPAPSGGESVRVPRWAARIRALGDANAFYAKSFLVDDIGTARALLDWRDALVDAGWDGGAIPNGGERLDALVAIENHPSDEALPLGDADRLVRIERALATMPARIYEAITLVEPRALWSLRWQRIFDRLEAQGTTFDAVMLDLPAAPPSTDLGVLQALLRGERVAPAVKGDGSLLVVRGDTPTDLAELTAALLASASEPLVVRALEPGLLDAALRRHGLATQGHGSASAWRPAMQVLPLAVELAYAPRDPYRVLELLTLPLGPFRGVIGERLARAVSRQPGIDGQEWRKQKEEAAKRLREWQLKDGKTEAEADAYVAARMARVAEWIEAPGAGPEGASRERLLAVGRRVKDWLQKRMGTDEAPSYAAAYAQAAAFVEALSNDDRASYAKEDARYLLDQLARGAHAHALSLEEAGRIPFVAHPSALLASRGTVVAWGFVAGTERAARRPPWHREELEALAQSGVVFPDPSELLRVEADAWRRVVLAARERVVLVVPASVNGARKSAHPLWDEIAARLGLDEAAAARITRSAHAVLEGREALVPTAPVMPLPLPEARDVWTIPPDALAAREEGRGTSATSLETLASCPLRWVLEQRADLRAGAIAKVAGGPLLFGSLTHRLVEVLHGEGAFDLPLEAFLAAARKAFDALLEREGATLLLEGASFERVQLTPQVMHAMRELHRYLQESGFRIAAVEEKIEAESAIGPLKGRLDVRLVDAEGRSAVLDLKWGASSYRALLEEGRAVQLAVYARAITKATNRTSMAPAGYFALGAGTILAADPRMKAKRLLEGDSLEVTLARVEATAGTVLAAHARGKVHVAASNKRSLPLLEALGVPENARDGHYQSERDAACTYCAHDAICGQRWEAFT